jgi:hypothetical protein
VKWEDQIRRKLTYISLWYSLLDISYFWTYDLYASYEMVLMRADPLRGQVGGGLGPGNRALFGPFEMA